MVSKIPQPSPRDLEMGTRNSGGQSSGSGRSQREDLLGQIWVARRGFLRLDTATRLLLFSTVNTEPEAVAGAQAAEKRHMKVLAQGLLRAKMAVPLPFGDCWSKVDWRPSRSVQVRVSLH